ncbi:hypothetical protein M0R45_030509 [Rubus argutus]|uniref:Uncharacterized protein n=1 Tax=Rubus argutus TaxID=59490 RepID=A0AAW1WDT0_RUBAR
MKVAVRSLRHGEFRRRWLGKAQGRLGHGLDELQISALFSVLHFSFIISPARVLLFASSLAGKGSARCDWVWDFHGVGEILIDASSEGLKGTGSMGFVSGDYGLHGGYGLRVWMRLKVADWGQKQGTGQVMGVAVIYGMG